MNTSTYTQAGNYTALIGLAVMILAKFGIVTDADSIATIVSGILILVGIIKQFIAHKKLAVATGTPIK